jgi:hypothetical protein
MSCGRAWPIRQLDAKPVRLRRSWLNRLKPRWLIARQVRRAADAGEDFDWLEGPCCYGPGYVGGGEIADTPIGENAPPTSANAQGTGGIAR